MDDAQAKREWVGRVLGVQFAPVARGSDGSGTGSPLSVWRDAKDRADAQLTRLYDTLRKSGVPALGRIADKIEDTLQGFHVPLAAKLMDLDRAAESTRDAARAAASKAVDEALARLASDARVRAVDRNPFAIPTDLRSTLEHGLTQLQAQLAAH